ncbi:odorant receptor 131-2-like [Solea senegalensis]|uniref:Odorant receptor 131-2-like n=1 Tax=Solea senegalensis TaxID=28829 RepID=A0AAV6SGA9_SOLSE|nr:odorant receptor 131-2-like [Solea senegalensis]KAG7517015.1 odorant receptor 131-2-like [Solea senegalensis]
MTFTNQSPANVTAGLQYQSFQEILILNIASTVPCCVFLFINGTMLYTLRSKAVFCDTSRYVLLYNLLLGDTLLLAQSQLLYLLSTLRVTMTYAACAAALMATNLFNGISPLTLVVMSLERYVAVCHPLKHATIITIRNTALAIVGVWALSSLNILTQVLLLLKFGFVDVAFLYTKDFCGRENIFLNPESNLYATGYMCFVFVLTTVAIVFSYIGVTISARLASSTDKASARKARKTLLLHLVQLGLGLLSTIHNPILYSISTSLGRVMIVRMQVLLYLCVIILPRCLSALIYGLRDQTIRPVLVRHLRCHCRP